MKIKSLSFLLALISILSLLLLAGCGTAHADPDLRAEAPPPATVVSEGDANAFKVDHPEQFPLIAATAHAAARELVVTGTVSPDVSRNVPVISLVSGRVVEIHARIGDTVQKGQLLLSVRSNDVASGFSDYRKAQADEILARSQLERAQDFYSHGAISMKEVQIAQNAEAKAKVDVETIAERLRLFGNDPDKPTPLVDIVAPVSGVITDQQVTAAPGMQALAPPNPFTISDLVARLGHLRRVRERSGSGAHRRGRRDSPERLSRSASSRDVSAISEPFSIPIFAPPRSGVEVENPGDDAPRHVRHGNVPRPETERRATVPASAILHLHDRDWVYVPTRGRTRSAASKCVAGSMLPGSLQEIRPASGRATGGRRCAACCRTRRSSNQ